MPLQALCSEQSYNNCLTARYRLKPAAALGTLLMAFIDDLTNINHGEKGVAGDLRPDYLEERWRTLAVRFRERAALPSGSPTKPGPPMNLTSLLEAKQGWVEGVGLEILLESLNSESTLATGDRLVLFGEVTEESASASEWQIATETLFARLPERVGLVLSGPPKNFVVPPDDPHFLEITLPTIDGPVADAEAPSAYRFTDSSFHTDEPSSKDELGVNDYANAIARFIVHPQTKAPLTLGINGPWGKGKSSFMNLVDAALIKYANVNRNVAQQELNGVTRTQHLNDLSAKLTSPDPSAGAGLSKDQPQEQLVRLEKTAKAKDHLWKLMEKDARQEVLSVRFNAWQFEDAKQTWAGLASQISETIEKSLSWRMRLALKLTYAWKERRSELILTLLLPLAVVLIVVGLVSAGFFAKLELGKPAGLGLLLPGSALLTIWFVSSQLLKVAVPISERVLSYTRMPNYREQMGFQHRVRDDLEFIRTFLTKHRPGCRVIVYIDDLDRCSEKKIMELLQAINLILASSKFFVVVGMDTEMIHRAIKAYYKETPTERSPDNYLRKIVQISFFLPDTMWQTRADYVNTLFSPEARLGLAKLDKGQAGGAPQEQSAAISPASGLAYNLENVLRIVPIVTKEAEDTADELQAFRDYSDFLNDNPREIKRLINIHRLIKILVQQPNTSWSGERQRKLVKWLIFCDRWPHLVDDALGLEERADSPDIFSALANDLAEKQRNNQSTDPSHVGHRLREFAEHTVLAAAKPVGPGESTDRRDPLLFKDIDAEFRLAANLSQLISKSPESEREDDESEDKTRSK